MVYSSIDIFKSKFLNIMNLSLGKLITLRITYFFIKASCNKSDALTDTLRANGRTKEIGNCNTTQCTIAFICSTSSSMLGDAVTTCERGTNIWYPPLGECIRNPLCE